MVGRDRHWRPASFVQEAASFSGCLMRFAFVGVLCGVTACSLPVPVDPGIVDSGFAVEGGDASVPTVADAGLPDAGFDASVAAVDAGPFELRPFWAQPADPQALHDVDADLAVVLERGQLANACARSRAAPDDRQLLLLCGKAMFFYEGFGTTGVPKGLVTWLLQHFSSEVGPGFSRLGMVADPNSSEGLPLGLAPGAPLGTAPTLAFTCASCHFSKLPDGRYAAGAANHSLDYGRLNLSLTLLAQTQVPGWSDAAHDPGALAKIEPMKQQLAADLGKRLSLLAALGPLIVGGQSMLPPFSRASESAYAQWAPGTMDFFIEPLPFDDRVHTVSKISPLYGLPTETELADAGIASAMLGASGGTASLANFLHSFVDLGGGKVADWPKERLAPLEAYILTLRAPRPPASMAAGDTAGRAVFAENCISCHQGPRGMGTRLFQFNEIGTDSALQWWADGPDHDGQPCCNLRFPSPDIVTNALKSPRLNGLWAYKRFLHNGSVESLEQLLCLQPRAGGLLPPLSSGGHLYGCGLPTTERQALLRYLRAQ
jgi:hypothetical protein